MYICVYIYVHLAVYKPHGNNKTKIYDRHTQKREKNPNITLKIVLKPQVNRTKEERTQK